MRGVNGLSDASPPRRAKGSTIGGMAELVKNLSDVLTTATAAEVLIRWAAKRILRRVWGWWKDRRSEPEPGQAGDSLDHS